MGLLNYYGSSIFQLLKGIYPDYDWKPWIFNKRPQLFNNESQIAYIKWISNQLNITNPTDWYFIPKKNLLSIIGKTYFFLDKVKLMEKLKSIYPNYEWKPWLFFHNHNFWKNLQNQIDFMNYLQKEMKIQKMEDWYNIRKTDIYVRGGFGLLNYYSGSIIKLFQAIFPDYDWKPWLFVYVRDDSWLSNMSKYFSWLENYFQINHLEQWYHISYFNIQKVPKGSILLKKYGGIKNFLSAHYKNYNINISFFDRSQAFYPSKIHINLFKIIKNIFPNEQIEIDYKLSPKSLLKLDIFLPNLKIAFEILVFYIIIF